MSDPSIEEDSLISQGDIDKLLESSSIEEAEDKLTSNSDSNDSNDVEELGELSQDDIDALMNGNISDPEGEDDAGELSQDDIDKMMNSNTSDSDDDLDYDDDDMELISQADIDSLMNSSEPDEPPDVAENEDAQEAGSEDDAGELSQDDIDKMMNSNASDVQEVEEDEAGELSQEDIDKMMNAGSDDEPSSSGDDEELEMISQDDIRNLINHEIEDNKESLADTNKTNPSSGNQPDKENPDLNGEDKAEASDKGEEIVEEKVEEPMASVTIEEDNSIIEESEAVDVTECLVTQETIDDLIKKFGSEPDPEAEPAPEPVILDEEPIPDSEEQISSEDELSADSDLLDMDGEDEDIAQEEIDALLLDSDDDEDYEEDDDLLISQDDIDTLLMAADQEDEDVLSDLMDEESDDDMEEDLNDEVISDEDEDFQGDDEDQVVLEDGNSEEVADAEPETAAKTKWYKSKLVIACASGLIAMGIIVPAVYFFFFSGDPGQPQNNMQQYAVEESRAITVETVDINIKSQGDINQAGNMVLENFVILASDQSKDMAYVTVDISIDYSDQRAYHEIQNNLSFYRDLIYDSINKSFVSEKREEITEADILWQVETSLKKVLPGTYINRVSFKSFKAS